MKNSLSSGESGRCRLSPDGVDDVAQEGLGQRGQQVFLVGVVAVEHRGRLTRRRRDVGQRGAVKTALGEQLSGRLFDGVPGLAALGCERLDRHGYSPSSRSPARSNALGSSWPTTRCATPRRGDRGLQVDIDVNSAVPQQIDQVLGGDVAARARRERAPAQPAHGGVEPGDARGHGGVCAGEPCAAGVVEVCAERDVGDQRSNLGDQVGHPPRRCGADGVGDREPVDVAVTRRLHDVEHPLRWRRAVERAVPCGGDDDLHRRPAVVGDGDDLTDQRRRPRRWSGRRSTGCGRRPPTPRTRWSAGPPRSPAWLRSGSRRGRRTRCRSKFAKLGGEFGGIGERGHLRRGDECRRLHLPHAGGSDRREQFELGGQRDRIFDLQTVAQRDIADVDVCR